MCEFMDNDFEIFKTRELGQLNFWSEIFVCHVDHANIFHASNSKFRAENIIILVPWKLGSKEIFVEEDCSFQESEELAWVKILEL